MSKKHFNDLASRLSALKPTLASNGAKLSLRTHKQGRLNQWQDMVKEVASFCAAQNPRFDRDRFLAACGME